MKLSNILNSNKNYKDKITAITKELPHALLVAWACDCAESVLHVFEEAYPEDKRPRQAIAAARKGNRNAAAYAANVAYAANAASNAASAAAAAAAYAAYAAYAAAAASADNAAKSKKEQEAKNLQLLRIQLEIYESGLYNAMEEESV